MGLGTVGLALASAAILVGQPLLPGGGEKILTVAGSTCMALAHLLNRRRILSATWQRPAHSRASRSSASRTAGSWIAAADSPSAKMRLKNSITCASSRREITGK